MQFTGHDSSELLFKGREREGEGEGKGEGGGEGEGEGQGKLQGNGEKETLQARGSRCDAIHQDPTNRYVSGIMHAERYQMIDFR